MRLLAGLCMLVLAVSLAMGQSTQPSGASAGLEIRANQAFSRGEYALALPLLKKVAEGLKDQPDRLGPVAEQIRVCEKNLANPPAIPQPPGPVDPPMSPEKRIAHSPPKPGETVELTIKELGNFEYDPDHPGNIPEDVRKMTGSSIRLRGFMIPMDQADRITQFALVPSLFACCFGQPPQIQHTIVVNCPAGKAVAYFPDEISVEGNLKVEEKKEDGYVISLFQLDAASVKPAAK